MLESHGPITLRNRSRGPALFLGAPTSQRASIGGETTPEERNEKKIKREENNGTRRLIKETQRKIDNRLKGVMEHSV